MDLSPDPKKKEKKVAMNNINNALSQVVVASSIKFSITFSPFCNAHTIDPCSTELLWSTNAKHLIF